MRAGFRLRLDVADPLQRTIADMRAYEPEVSWVYPYLLRDGDVAIDGGAHIGYISLLMARAVGQRGAVHAFEPVGSTFARLVEDLALNAGAPVVPRRCALGARAGTLELEVPIDPHGTALLTWGASAVRLGRGGVESVPVVSLDEYAAQQGLARIALVKLDLEGAELPAIEGARRLLGERRITYLVCELNRFLLDQQGVRYDELRREVTRYGYCCYALTKDARLRRVDAPLMRPPIGLDLLFAREGPA